MQRSTFVRLPRDYEQTIRARRHTACERNPEQRSCAAASGKEGASRSRGADPLLDRDSRKAPARRAGAFRFESRLPHSTIMAAYCALRTSSIPERTSSPAFKCAREPLVRAQFPRAFLA
ncbi:hypothetical protein [Burkholderia sp. BDU5]|uniref:hypothetical protein n=1 Tax=Burkholderia sp. BDU5 TaxID=1385590 RepID=UPI0012E343E2|nr:hypothetical protein [Burkholderia sp. BDU5]